MATRERPVTPAEELRAAANLMRERAGKADAGPWDSRNLGRHDRSAVVTRAIGAPILIGSFEGARGAHNGIHAAGMHPGVALAVADWLEQEAFLAPETGETDGRLLRPLWVARAYMGEEAAGGPGTPR